MQNPLKLCLFLFWVVHIQANVERATPAPAPARDGVLTSDVYTSQAPSPVHSSGVSDGTLKLGLSSNPKTGFLMISYNNQWGLVCDDGWTYLNADIACVQLGFRSASVIDNAMPYTSELSAYPMLLDNVACVAGQTSLAACANSGWGEHNCEHEEAVSLVCTNVERVTPAPAPPTAGLLSLKFGSSPANGFLLVSYQGEWGLVCDDNWNYVAADVACRQLGYKSAAVVNNAVSSFSAVVSYPIVLDNVACTGSEPRLMDCSHAAWGSHNCAVDEAVSLTCSSTPRAQPEQPATPSPAPSAVGLLSLKFGSSPITGFLFVSYQGQWGLVCDDSWNFAAADVACRQLGYKHAAVANTAVSSYSAVASYPIVLDDVRCTGSEPRLMDCSHAPWGSHNCAIEEAVSLTCSVSPRPTPAPTPNPTGPVSGQEGSLTLSLSGGATDRGYLYVMHNGVWGLVCSGNGWDIYAAEISCRQLGFLRAVSSLYTGDVGPPATSLMWIQQARCFHIYAYTSLVRCTISWGSNCGSSPPVKLHCSNTLATPAPSDTGSSGPASQNETISLPPISYPSSRYPDKLVAYVTMTGNIDEWDAVKLRSLLDAVTVSCDIPMEDFMVFKLTPGSVVLHMEIRLLGHKIDRVSVAQRLRSVFIPNREPTPLISELDRAMQGNSVLAIEIEEESTLAVTLVVVFCSIAVVISFVVLGRYLLHKSAHTPPRHAISLQDMEMASAPAMAVDMEASGGGHPDLVPPVNVTANI